MECRVFATYKITNLSQKVSCEKKHIKTQIKNLIFTGNCSQKILNGIFVVVIIDFFPRVYTYFLLDLRPVNLIVMLLMVMLLIVMLLNAHYDAAHHDDAYHDAANREAAHREAAHHYAAHRDAAHHDAAHHYAAHGCWSWSC